jgi:hypothetical protein
MPNTEFTFSAYEFGNGAILVPGKSTNDWYHASIDDIEAGGSAVVVGYEETGFTAMYTREWLKESIEGSENEFGEDSIPDNVRELIED